jgi:endonuclease/exonuclease/phosphatase family metal-dependent hydrolase
VRLLVRSWNLFHGNTVPPGRLHRLEEMIHLASADEPDIVCLQEVPPWALERLEDWSGMTCFGDVAAPPRLGPFPSTAALGRLLTGVNHGLLRSAFSGQANAILAAPSFRLLGRQALELNSRDFRRRQSRWLRLSPVARFAWAKERRLCQAVRLALPDGRAVLVAHIHATSYPPDERLADAEAFRAAVFADALARPDDVCVLAGDFNVKAARSWTLRELTGPEWGFAGTGPWIDHILVRGAPAGPVERWPDERRRRGGRLLSDHAPVEVRVE